jgi:hypothetical protein
MSLGLSNSLDPADVIPSVQKPEDTNNGPKKIPREQLIQEGKVVLTEKLDLATSVQLKIDVLLRRFRKIKLPHTKERLSEKEK